MLGHGTSGPPRDVTERFYRHAEEFALAALSSEYAVEVARS